MSDLLLVIPNPFHEAEYCRVMEKWEAHIEKYNRHLCDAMVTKINFRFKMACGLRRRPYNWFNARGQYSMHDILFD